MIGNSSNGNVYKELSCLFILHISLWISTRQTNAAHNNKSMLLIIMSADSTTPTLNAVIPTTYTELDIVN